MIAWGSADIRDPVEPTATEGTENPRHGMSDGVVLWPLCGGALQSGMLLAYGVFCRTCEASLTRALEIN